MKSKYFESVESLNKLLEDNKDIFEMVDDYGQQFIQGILSTPEDYKDALNKLTGAYLSLMPLYQMAVAYKENEELKYYVTAKRELEAKAEKVVAASLEKESSAFVEHPRRVRNLLEGYVEASSKGIATCQTQLKRLELEGKLTPKENE
jgi:arginyl-tRNA synthetase